MNFVLIANAWGAGIDNPTSKHRIALELARRGHRVLWVEGAGMRTPSLSSGSDRGRILGKIRAAFRGARLVWGGAGRKPTSLCELRRSREAQETQEERERTLLRQGYGGQAGSTGFTGCGEGRTGQEGSEEGLQSAVSSLQSDSGALWVLTPLSIPLPRYELVRRLNGVLYAWAARRACRRLGFGNPVLINYVPVLAEAMKQWRSKPARQPVPSLQSPVSSPPIIYHCVDRWDAFAMYDSSMMRDMDERCCRYADVVIASSNDLLERCRKQNANTHLVMHGVDYEHFAKALRHVGSDRGAAVPPREAPGMADLGGSAAPPTGDEMSGAEPIGCPLVADREAAVPPGEALGRSDLGGSAAPPTGDEMSGAEPTGCPSESGRPADLPEGRIVGFFGLLSEWLDQELLLALSDAVGENASLVLIGTADVDVSRLEGIPNIHLLGPKPFSELPEYIAHFEVGVIPFVLNELTRAVNPIKLREMMAAGCPVVSSALPEVEKYATGEGVSGAVHVARSQEDFVSAVIKRLAAPLALEQRRVLSDRMRVETWSHKVDEILAAIGL